MRHMHRSSLFAAASLVIICLSCPPASAEGRTERIHVVERATNDTTAHVGQKDDNNGDILTFVNDVYDADNVAKVGSDEGFCIRVAVGKVYHCMWSTSLPAGQITVQGPFLDSGDSVLAVTGGTGDYANVRGEMLLHARDAKGNEYDFTYVLRHADP